MDTTNIRDDGFDGAAAVTRSLLGWGVVAAGFYLLVGLAQAFVRDGYEFSQHPLSLLMLGDYGWIQRTNIILSGTMVLAAAWGLARAMRGTRTASRAGVLLGAFGVGMIASGIFPPDPMAGFPAGATTAEGTVSGMLHLAFGAIGFLCLAASAFVAARWLDQLGEPRRARFSRVSGGIVALGFIGGAALSTQAAGVIALWIAVVAGLAWLAVVSVAAYRTVPHPDADRRATMS